MRSKKSKPEFLRFNSLATTNVKCDFHIHTSWTDGHSPAKDYAAEALRKQLSAIAFTEHVRKTSGWFDYFASEIREIAINSELEILVGIEAKALDMDGNLDCADYMLDELDIVLGTVHRYPVGDGYYVYSRDLPTEQAAEIEFKLACALLQNHLVDVLAHPGGVFEKHHKQAFPKDYLETIIKVANREGKAIELNSSYLQYPSDVFELCSKYNPLVSLGSDAHSITELGTILQFIYGEFLQTNDKCFSHGHRGRSWTEHNQVAQAIPTSSQYHCI